MASLTVSFITTLIGCCLFLGPNGFVDGRFVRNSRQQEMDFECMQTLSLCMMPLYGMDPQILGQQVAVNGLNAVCQPLLGVESCLNAQLNSCGRGLPEQITQAFNMLSQLVDFTCRQEIQSINAERHCLLGQQLAIAVASNCQAGLQPPSGNVCGLVEETECGFKQFETVCRNKPLADKFRNFVAKLERDSGCNTLAAKSISWRDMITMLKR